MIYNKIVYLVIIVLLVTVGCAEPNEDACHAPSPDEPIVDTPDQPQFSFLWEVDIKPFLNERCKVCHTGNPLPDWQNYDTVKSKSSIVRYKIINKIMPLGSTLTDNQINMIVTWIDEGMPRQTDVVVVEPTQSPVPTDTPNVVTITPTTAPQATIIPVPTTTVTQQSLYDIAKAKTFNVVCNSCHNETWSNKNWLVESTAISNVNTIRSRVVGGTMPPSYIPRLTTEQYDAILNWANSITVTATPAPTQTPIPTTTQAPQVTPIPQETTPVPTPTTIPSVLTTYEVASTTVFVPVCSMCHNESWSSKNWLVESTAISNANLIKSRVLAGTMPPSYIAPLTAQQIANIVAWVDSIPVAVVIPTPVPTVTPIPQVTNIPTPTVTPALQETTPQPTPTSIPSVVSFYDAAKTNVFTPICGSCHNSGWSSKNWQVESTALANKDKIKTRAIDQGSMPPSNPLQAQQKQYLQDWYDSVSYNFSYVTSAWSGCTNSTQSRSVTCTRTDNGAVYSDAFCTNKPNTTQSCVENVITYDWLLGSWQACSVSCGGGSQFRNYACYSSEGVESDASLCDPNTEPSFMDTLQACNTQACGGSYSWVEYPWSQCNKPDGETYAICGGGIQTRSLGCIHDDTGYYVDQSFCNQATKPATSTTCNTQACPSGSVTFDKAECVSVNGLYLEGRVTGFSNGRIWIDRVPWGYIDMIVDADGRFKMANSSGGFVISCPTKLRGYTDNGIYFDNVIPEIKY